MTKEEKQLLLNDLCGRIPHGVKCQINIGDGDYYIDTLYSITSDGCAYFLDDKDETEYVLVQHDIQPYLFPLSSMSEEQESDLNLYLRLDKEPIMRSVKEIDWYNKNHFDIHGLIPLGLAIDCTNLNIY